MFTSAPPSVPPINPPAACSPADPITPPQDSSAAAGMKNVPIMRPAIAAEKTDAATATVIVDFCVAKVFLYPASLEVTSYTMLAAMKPKKKSTVAGFMMKVTPVAMRPTVVSAPGFLIHHAVTVRMVNPMRSQRIGSPVRLKTTGENTELSTPHRAAPMAMAATSRLLKYGMGTLSQQALALRTVGDMLYLSFVGLEMALSTKNLLSVGSFFVVCFGLIHAFAIFAEKLRCSCQIAEFM